MAAKTLSEFYTEWRAYRNPVTGEGRLFRDLSDQEIWDAAIKSVEVQNPSPNTQSSTCRCVLKDMPHFQSKTADRVTAVSLSLEVNKECPIHGHYFG